LANTRASQLEGGNPKPSINTMRRVGNFLHNPKS
jgi:hypothetical protein